MITRKIFIVLCFLGLILSNCYSQNEVINLWEGKAPGSENWTQTEEISDSPSGRFIQNVVEPTITAFIPEKNNQTGTAVIVCPGGGFRTLSWDGEGVGVAKWLNDKGITAFVLKYRIVDTSIRNSNQNNGGGSMQMKIFNAPSEIVNANTNPSPENQELNKVIDLAIDDGQKAIRIIRTNAEKWNIDPQKIGLLGFSAGGGVAIGTALRDDRDAYPNFIATAYGPALFDVFVPENAPPLFMAVASNHRNVAPGCIALYNVWKKAGKSAELHLYAKGSGPFGIEKKGIPSDNWIDRFYEWLKAEGF